MRSLLRAAAALVLLVSCTGVATGPSLTVPGRSQPPTSTPEPSGAARSFTLPPSTTGKESAAAVRTRLCVRPPAPSASPAAATASPPAAVSEVEHEVEQVRGLDYEHPVAVDPVTHAQLVQGLDASFDHSFPAGMLGRRSKAWATIGVIPPGTSLLDAYKGFLSSQVIGYYDPSSKQLVFIGTSNPSPVERFTLAHELTHADDDQHFGLAKLNVLESRCDDEGLQAATGAVEGSAVYFSVQVVQQFFSAGDQAKLALGGGGGSGLPAAVPPFVQHLEEWPYIDGPTFIRDIRSFGGLHEVNQAIATLPPSTEQIMHPSHYPDDRPVEMNTPDLGPTLGPGWRDLDVMDTGEEWIREMLALRLDGSLANEGADGWGGAQYRAWTDGTHVAVLLDTTWDTPDDATQFLDVMRQWTRGRDDAVVGSVEGNDRGVVALFGSDAATLHRLEAALG
jgi:hypothetical protein